jgi:putative ABC transport system ATP-binding protein
MNPVVLAVQHLSLTFPGIEKPVLNNIDYEIREQDFVVILGSNGSGKSSLLKCLNRHYQACSGNVLLAGKCVTKYQDKTLRRDLKTLTQNADDSLFLSLTVFENYLLIKNTFEFSFFPRRESRLREFFAEYLVKFNPNLPEKLNQLSESLSGGEKQALTLALTMLYPPKILLLDEHTSALDPKSAAALMLLTRALALQHKITCVLTTHDLAIAEAYGNRILALRHGKIYQQIDCDVKDKFDQKELLAACY